MARIRKRNYGIYAGLSAPSVAELAGLPVYVTRNLLKQRLIELNRDLTLDDIGQLVYQVRSKVKTDLKDYLEVMKGLYADETKIS